ncbi:hypothetical protein [Rickettsiella grylli]|uniref:Uncharacterized protein n=1 Tax=Rickettsiella grylli TaxID=59196 RepID=A8PN62_9COXI|nr:hypothetical protein [Rickettsiella grylli]EDP46108.1 hypothetical protein RICGR_0912 [Rickettsiella grylli]OIZ98891.1 hypothetical protein BEV13_06505 [Rickettsiella grylli]
MNKITSLKILIAVALIVIASLAYLLLTRFFPSEEVFFMGSRALTRGLILDLAIKKKDYPSFLTENSAFLVVHPAQSAEDHRADILETRDIFALIEKTNKNTIHETDPLYAELELLFLKKKPLGIRANYMTLASLGVKSLFFNPDYLNTFSQIYQDKLPHAAGYAIMGDGSQRQIRDILINAF